MDFEICWTKKNETDIIIVIIVRQLEKTAESVSKKP